MEVKTLRLKFWSDFIRGVRFGLSTPTRSSSVLLQTHLLFHALFTHLLFAFRATNWFYVAYASRRKASLDPGPSCGPEATESIADSFRGVKNRWHRGPILSNGDVVPGKTDCFRTFKSNPGSPKSKISGSEEAKHWIIKRAITEKTCFEVLQACFGGFISYYITHTGVCFVFCKHVNHSCLLTSRRSLVSLTWICLTWRVINWVMCDSYWPHAAVCSEPWWSKHVLIIALLMI